MTDKEIVDRAKEAEKRTGFGELVYSPISKGVNSAFGIGFIEGIVEYRNSLQEEPVSEELEEASKEWLKPQLDKSYANYGEAKMMELTHFDGYAMLDAIEFGAERKEEQIKEALLSEVLPFFMHGGEADEVVAKLDEVLNQK